MDINQPEARKNGLGYDNTILAYKLATWQIELLNEAVKVKEINGRKVMIYETDVFTDLFAIPHFIAFINFECASEADKQTFIEYWRECRESKPDDVLEELPAHLIHKMPLTYVLNCRDLNIDEGNYLFYKKDIFSDRERLRLAMMQEIKNIEGKGRNANEKSSEKLRRVLHMYKELVYKGWISKDKVDRWLDLEGQKQISDRTFMRDMRIIQSFDTRVRYNPDRKRYELNLETYFLNKNRT